MDFYKDLFLMQQTYSTLFSVTNKLQVQGDQYLQSLTSRRCMAMVAIVHLPEGGATLNNIARKLGTTKQSVKQLIDILEKKGYVNVVPSKQDKRAVNVGITESGKQVLMECSEKSIYFFAEAFKHFTTEEMEILWSLLKKLYRFDGEEQSGFEEEIEFERDNLTEVQSRAMKEFARLRTESEMKRRSNE